jgi:hypothetical protein
MQIELNEEEVIAVVNKYLEGADDAVTAGQRFWVKYHTPLQAYLEAEAPKKQYDYDRNRNCEQIRNLKEGLSFATPGQNVAKQLRLMFLLDHVLKEIRESDRYSSGVTIKSICIGPFPEGGWRSPEIEGYKARENEFQEALGS